MHSGTKHMFYILDDATQIEYFSSVKTDALGYDAYVQHFFQLNTPPTPNRIVSQNVNFICSFFWQKKSQKTVNIICSEVSNIRIKASTLFVGDQKFCGRFFFVTS